MAKGYYIYDPERKEFTVRDSSRPWSLEESDAVTSRDPSARGRSPARRRRRRKKGAGAAPEESRGPGRRWRWVMWALILIMTVVWLSMIVHQSRTVKRPGVDEKDFEFDRRVLSCRRPILCR